MSVATDRGYNKFCFMTVAAIEAFLNKRPFRAFHLVTVSGESYKVPHPEFVTFSPSRRTCNVYGEDGEYFSTLDILTITDIQPDGRSRARRR
jgi:hypothetical protein